MTPTNQTDAKSTADMQAGLQSAAVSNKNAMVAQSELAKMQSETKTNEAIATASLLPSQALGKFVDKMGH